jgi:hypothetical protein
MAIQDKSLSAAEHDWFAIRSGEPANAPLSQHKYGYFASKSIPQAPITQMERNWLTSIPTVSIPNETDELSVWQRVCANAGVTVGKTVNECKFNFFTTVASGTNP